MDLPRLVLPVRETNEAQDGALHLVQASLADGDGQNPFLTLAARNVFSGPIRRGECPDCPRWAAPGARAVRAANPGIRAPPTPLVGARHDRQATELFLGLGAYLLGIRCN